MWLDTDEPASRTQAIFLFGAIALFIGADLVSDSRSGTAVPHIVFELSVVGLALAGAGLLWREARSARREVRRLDGDLSVARAEAERWRSDAGELLQGLGAAIDGQFERWELTAAERAVGLLLLKGLSHKEVAGVRRTSERTVRQQALVLYRKSGLRGRAELAAFFLEDLLLPAKSTPSGPYDDGHGSGGDAGRTKRDLAVPALRE